MSPADFAWQYRSQHVKYRRRTVARGFKATKGTFSPTDARSCAQRSVHTRTACWIISRRVLRTRTGPSAIGSEVGTGKDPSVTENKYGRKIAGNRLNLFRAGETYLC